MYHHNRDLLLPQTLKYTYKMKSNQKELLPAKVYHPGVTLKEKLEELNMGPKEFAIRSGKPEKTIAAILKGTSSITPEMAILFENILKIPAHFWLNNQRYYDRFMEKR